MLRTALRSLALCASLALCGCAPASSASATYVGAVEQSQARIAVYTQNGLLAAYVCGGASDFQTLTGWFFSEGAPPAQGAFELRGDGLVLQLQQSGAGYSGSVRDAHGASHAFTATLAADGAFTGLYHAVDDGCRTGVIITQDSPSADPSVQGIWCNNVGAREQVTPVLPLALRAGGLAMRTSVQSVTRELSVVRLRLPLQ